MATAPATRRCRVDRGGAMDHAGRRLFVSGVLKGKPFAMHYGPLFLGTVAAGAKMKRGCKRGSKAEVR